MDLYNLYAAQIDWGGCFNYIYWYTSHEIKALFRNITQVALSGIINGVFLESLGGAVAAQRGQTGKGQRAQNVQQKQF